MQTPRCYDIFFRSKQCLKNQGERWVLLLGSFSDLCNTYRLALCAGGIHSKRILAKFHIVENLFIRLETGGKKFLW